MPRIAVRAIVIRDEKILLSRYFNQRGYWHVTPGGGVEQGETIEEAFARETWEECGHSLPFGEVKFIREVIADRHEDTFLKPGFHQVEIYVLSQLSEEIELKPITPDESQVDLVWHPLDQLDQILFFPAGLTEQFMNQSWERMYYGETG